MYVCMYAIHQEPNEPSHEEKVRLVADRKARKKAKSLCLGCCTICMSKKITRRLQLMSIAATQNREGKKDLGEFICYRGGRRVSSYCP